MTLLLLACAFPARVQKSLLAPDYVTPLAPTGQVAQVTYLTGAYDEPPTPYAPVVLDTGGKRYDRVIELTTGGWVEVAPLTEDVTLSVWVRSNGLLRHEFSQVRSVTGALDRAHPNEIRFLPERLDAPYRLRLRQLTNVYNDYEFGHGDLLLIEASAPNQEPERYLFKAYEFGPRFKFSGGLLLTVPLSFVSDTMPQTTSPAAVFTTAFGYRFRSRSPLLRWIGGNSSVLLSMGVGSTALGTPDFAAPVEEQIAAAFLAHLAGGGFEFYDFVSVQALVNISSLNRDVLEAPWVMAVGFDAVQFGVFTRDLGSRLLRRNTLDEAPPAPQGG